MTPNVVRAVQVRGLAVLITCLTSLLIPSPRLRGAAVSQELTDQPATNRAILLVPQRVFGTADGGSHENWVVLVSGR
jgi:hypothetical protein